MKKTNVLRAVFLTALAGMFSAAPQRASAEILTALTFSGSLITFDTATPSTILSSVAVSGLGTTQLVAIDTRPANGQLYGLGYNGSGASGRLFVINQTTGVATQVGSTGAFTLAGTSFGMDFNPTVDRIRVTSDFDQNLRLNPNDGTLTGTDGTLAYAAGDPNAGANPNIVGSGYTNDNNPGLGTTLYDIDSVLNILTIQNPPNNGTLNTVGALGIDVPNVPGFQISGATGIAYLAFGDQLYRVNLATGAATSLGTVGPGGTVNIIGLAQGVPEPGTLALAGLTVVGVFGSWLVRRRRTK